MVSTGNWKGIGELPHCQAPVSVVAAVRAATGLELPLAPASPEYVACVLENEQAISLSRASGDRRRGPWKRPPTPRKLGPWVRR